MLFFICDTREDAESKALSLRQSGYNTEIKERRNGPYDPRRVYKVYGINKLPRQLMIGEIRPRKRKIGRPRKIKECGPTRTDLKEVEKWATEA